MPSSDNPKIIFEVPPGTLPEFAAYLHHDPHAILCICCNCLLFSVDDTSDKFTPAKRHIAALRTAILDKAAKQLSPTSHITRMASAVQTEEVQRLVRALLLDHPAVTNYKDHITRRLGTSSEEEAWGFIYPLFNRAAYRGTDVTPGSVAQQLAQPLAGPIDIDGDPNQVDSIITTSNILVVALAAYRGALFEPPP